MGILLKSKPIKITAIKRKTQAKMLCNLVVGDIIQLSIKASRAGSNKGTYASYITVEHLKTGDKTGFSFNQISTLYNAFELEEVDSEDYEATMKIKVEEVLNKYVKEMMNYTPNYNCTSANQVVGETFRTMFGQKNGD